MNQVVDVSISEVQDGARLASDLIDKHGALILPAGTVLNQSMLQRLLARDIERLTILQEEILSEEEQAARKLELEQQISQRFRKCEGNPLMQTLKQSIINYRNNGN